jgi:hypothetical protein
MIGGSGLLVVVDSETTMDVVGVGSGLDGGPRSGNVGLSAPLEIEQDATNNAAAVRA